MENKKQTIKENKLKGNLIELSVKDVAKIKGGRRLEKRKKGL